MLYSTLRLSLVILFSCSVSRAETRPRIEQIPSQIRFDDNGGAGTKISYNRLSCVATGLGNECIIKRIKKNNTVCTYNSYRTSGQWEPIKPPVPVEFCYSQEQLKALLSFPEWVEWWILQ